MILLPQYKDVFMILSISKIIKKKKRKYKEWKEN